MSADVAAFGRDLLAVMHARSVSLRQAAREADVAPIIVSRVTRYGEACSLENFARLCAWSGLPADPYILRTERVS